MPYLTLPLRHVFIVGDNSMFEEGITNLLSGVKSLKVSAAKYLDDSWFVNTIALLQPDIILVAESNILSSTHLLGLLFSAKTPLRDARIVVVRLTDNIVGVYKMPKQSGKQTPYQQIKYL